MKLTTDFSALWHNIERMGAVPSDFVLDTEKPKDGFSVDDASLSRGIEIKLEHLEPVGGLLSIQGRQVLLYIPDQGGSIDSVVNDGSKGKRFHVANCSTLHKMRSLNRIERYVVTNDLSGNFKVHGFHNRKKEGVAQLVVCKNCLKHLNYKGYKNGSSAGPKKFDIFNNFSISEFFARHSTLFAHTPKQLEATLAGYSDDWETVSANYRASVNYSCEQCSVNLQSHKNLIHCHHVNGVKRDNSANNLQALCKDCHRKQPMHQHMSLTAKEMDILNTCRREQGFFENSSWVELLDLVDSSFHGILQTYQRRGTPIPEVGYDIQNENRETVVTAEVAWPRDRKAIVFDETEVNLLESLGWEALTLNSTVDNAAQGMYLV